MLLFETFMVAFRSIRGNVLRSVLTTLGIIIGVGAVITMVALGAGAQKAVEEQIESIGPNVLQIYPSQSFSRGIASQSRVSLTTDDATALRQDATLLEAVVPELTGSMQAKFGGTNINTSISGVSANFPEVKRYKLAFGRSFTEGDDQARQRYAVVAAEIPSMLNANAQALIGQTIMIRGISFEIIGVLRPKGASNSWQNPDEIIFIPLNTARYRVFGSDRLRAISVEGRAGVPIEQVMVDIERVLRREHKIRPGMENDFSIRGSQEVLATQEATTQIFTSLLASIAAVSLVVGGIGIMNIMLVTVTERTREIGVRKALGATKVNIMFQFLVESLVLCLVGGAIGVGLGTWVTGVLAKNNGWNALVSPESVLIAFGTSAAIGLIFGLWPAYRAARLDPIVALRYE
jgi:putative ABC transport system permease protein